MASTKVILTSVHGRALGISADSKLVLWGRTVPSMDDAGVFVGVQAAPGALNTTGTLTAALLKSGILLSSTPAGVTGTFDTGANIDAAFTGKQALSVNDAFDLHVINTGVANTFTVATASGVTAVGSLVVNASTSGKFRIRKTSAGNFVVYRIA